MKLQDKPEVIYV